MALQGKSILDVTKTLNAEGIPTTNGKKWLKTTIHTMLDNEAYTGSRGLGSQGQGRRASGAGRGRTSRHHLQGGVPEGSRSCSAPAAPKKDEPPPGLQPLPAQRPRSECQTCGKAMTAAEAKSGKYTYYVCHSLLKRGKRHLQDPQAQRQELRGAYRRPDIRENVLTESNIRDLVKLLDEEMDGVAARAAGAAGDHRRRSLRRSRGGWAASGRLHSETTDIVDVADASDRISGAPGA